MTTLSPKLTVDEAVAEFMANRRKELGPPDAARSGTSAPETPEEAEARLFRCAEDLLRRVCPDPARCADHRCRRLTLCRHFADLRERQRAQRSPHPRRTPGAAALRHAIWIYMNAGRA